MADSLLNPGKSRVLSAPRLELLLLQMLWCRTLLLLLPHQLLLLGWWGGWGLCWGGGLLVVSALVAHLMLLLLRSLSLRLLPLGGLRWSLFAAVAAP
ncbi:hypothetical protein CLOM_g11961 [Closterium sp. NIES-68]|nr:hypothetical protein CLOM_g11961 [Closterium sp. NIES-68]